MGNFGNKSSVWKLNLLIPIMTWAKELFSNEDHARLVGLVTMHPTQYEENSWGSSEGWIGLLTVYWTEYPKKQKKTTFYSKQTKSSPSLPFFLGGSDCLRLVLLLTVFWKQCRKKHKPTKYVTECSIVHHPLKTCFKSVVGELQSNCNLSCKPSSSNLTIHR